MTKKESGRNVDKKKKKIKFEDENVFGDERGTVRREEWKRKKKKRNCFKELKSFLSCLLSMIIYK